MIVPNVKWLFTASQWRNLSWNFYQHVGNMPLQHLSVAYFWPQGHVLATQHHDVGRFFVSRCFPPFFGGGRGKRESSQLA
jgi:hypothetical protein